MPATKVKEPFYQGFPCAILEVVATGIVDKKEVAYLEIMLPGGKTIIISENKILWK
jgi:hypothetical protein